jgi:hypothetical protein
MQERKAGTPKTHMCAAAVCFLCGNPERGRIIAYSRFQTYIDASGVNSKKLDPQRESQGEKHSESFDWKNIKFPGVSGY